MSFYKELGARIGALVDTKQAAYGDSFGKAGGIIAILYPRGIPLEALPDALAIIRVVDKLFRIATDRDALGESPWGDIAGYALLSVARVERQREEARYATKDPVLAFLTPRVTPPAPTADLSGLAAREAAACPPGLHPVAHCATAAPQTEPPAAAAAPAEALAPTATAAAVPTLPPAPSQAPDAAPTPAAPLPPIDRQAEPPQADWTEAQGERWKAEGRKSGLIIYPWVCLRCGASFEERPAWEAHTQVVHQISGAPVEIEVDCETYQVTPGRLAVGDFRRYLCIAADARIIRRRTLTPENTAGPALEDWMTVALTGDPDEDNFITLPPWPAAEEPQGEPTPERCTFLFRAGQESEARCCLATMHHGEHRSGRLAAAGSGDDPQCRFFPNGGGVPQMRCALPEGHEGQHVSRLGSALSPLFVPDAPERAEAPAAAPAEKKPRAKRERKPKAASPSEAAPSDITLPPWEASPTAEPKAEPAPAEVAAKSTGTGFFVCHACPTSQRFPSASLLEAHFVSWPDHKPKGYPETPKERGELVELLVSTAPGIQAGPLETSQGQFWVVAEPTNLRVWESELPGLEACAALVIRRAETAAGSPRTEELSAVSGQPVTFPYEFATLQDGLLFTRLVKLPEVEQRAISLLPTPMVGALIVDLKKLARLPSLSDTQHGGYCPFCAVYLSQERLAAHACSLIAAIREAWEAEDKGRGSATTATPAPVTAPAAGAGEDPRQMGLFQAPVATASRGSATTATPAAAAISLPACTRCGGQHTRWSEHFSWWCDDCESLFQGRPVRPGEPRLNRAKNGEPELPALKPQGPSQAWLNHIAAATTHEQLFKITEQLNRALRSGEIDQALYERLVKAETARGRELETPATVTPVSLDHLSELLGGRLVKALATLPAEVQTTIAGLNRYQVVAAVRDMELLASRDDPPRKDSGLCGACVLCGKDFTSEIALSEHACALFTAIREAMAEAAKGATPKPKAPADCTWCGKRYSDEGALARHRCKAKPKHPKPTAEEVAAVRATATATPAEPAPAAAAPAAPSAPATATALPDLEASWRKEIAKTESRAALKKLRKELDNARELGMPAALHEVLAEAIAARGGELPVPEPVNKKEHRKPKKKEGATCARCGLSGFEGEKDLAKHLEEVHGAGGKASAEAREAWAQYQGAASGAAEVSHA